MGPQPPPLAPEGGMWMRDFRPQFVTVDLGGSGVLGRVVPHREQHRHFTALDTVGADGQRQFREFFLHWSKKTAKSFTAAVTAVHHLVADPFERVDRLVAIASFD